MCISILTARLYYTCSIRPVLLQVLSIQFYSTAMVHWLVKDYHDFLSHFRLHSVKQHLFVITMLIQAYFYNSTWFIKKNKPKTCLFLLYENENISNMQKLLRLISEVSAKEDIKSNMMLEVSGPYLCLYMINYWLFKFFLKYRSHLHDTIN